MKRILHPHYLLALFTAVMPLATQADTFFTDTFTNGSTTNGVSIPGGATNASHTSYDVGSSKNALASTVLPGYFSLKLNTATTSGYLEAQALFTTNPVTLTTAGDYIDIAIVFTNTGGTLLAGGNKSLISIGLYNSGGAAPVAGLLANAGLNTTASSPYATGNCALWQGYIAQICNAGTTSRMFTRPLQNGVGTASANQELLGPGGSGGTFANPAGATIATAPTATFAFNAGAQYTLDLRLTLTDVNTYTISNALYSGIGTGGTIVFSQINTNVSGANYLTGAFDGLAVGSFNSGTSFNPTMDITAIMVTGQTTPITGAPVITAQPSGVTVASGGSTAFTVAATGFGLTYQWHRHGTNLVNAGNIFGATSSQLIVSPASAGDVETGANGYWVTVTGTGGFSVNSTTNSLTLVAAKNLVWAGSDTTWDVNNTVSWVDPVNPSVFNYGDAVTFNDSASLRTVTLSGNYISASSVTLTGAQNYTWQGTGSFAGPGNMVVANANLFDLKNANTYSGGTLISNANAYVFLENYNGFGTGPVVLGMAGGTIETKPTGSASLGINGDILVADDFTIQIDGMGTFATVFLGNLSGTAGKVLTLNQNPGNSATNQRVRVYGNNTTYNGNLVINSPLITLAPYQPNGTQVYNGVISGDGNLVQRGSGTTILNGNNVYTGGTIATAGGIGFGIDSTPTTGTVTSGPIGTGPLFIAPEAGSANGSGTVLASGGARTIANPLQYPTATNNQTLVVGGTNALTFTGPYTLNGNDLFAAPTNRVFQVNNSNAWTTLSGVISDNGQGFGFNKTGAGTLALNNTETYSGLTTVSAGVLAGSGSIAGSVLVTTNASIGGGSAASIGTLTINGNLTLTNGGGFFRLNRSGSASDKVSVAGALTNSGTVGTIIVTNLGAALQVGDTFTLFNKAVSNGASLLISGGNAVWTNKLAVNGTIQVIPGVNTNPTNIVAHVSGNILTLSWPADHTGFRLQMQTNALSVGLRTNWVDVAGSTSVNSTNITINPANGAVFYRLVYP